MLYYRIIVIFLFFFPACLYFLIFLQWICYKKKKTQKFSKKKKNNTLKNPLPFLPFIMTWVFGLQWDILPPMGRSALVMSLWWLQWPVVQLARLLASVVNQTQAVQFDIHNQASQQGCQVVSSHRPTLGSCHKQVGCLCFLIWPLEVCLTHYWSAVMSWSALDSPTLHPSLHPPSTPSASRSSLHGSPEQLQMLTGQKDMRD